jgi:phage terminase Nu1 subunit (DNA packaging protein)
MAEEKPKGVPVRYLMEKFACSHTLITEYEREGLVIRLGRNLYDFDASCPRVMKHIREQAAGRIGRNAGNDAVKANIDLKKSQQRLAEIRAERLAGNLVPVDLVEQSWGEIAASCRQIMLSVPARARAMIHKLNGKDQKVLDKMMREALTEFAFGTQKPPIPRDRGEATVE